MSSISYYAVIPSWVLSHSQLSASEKLMCALISAMSQKSGYCFATNEALAVALNVTESSVKYVLQKLESSNIIAIHNKKTKKAGNRQIRLVFAERIEDGEEVQEAPELPRDEIADAFDRFYEIYPRKEKRVPALKMFKTKKLHKRIEELIRATKNYISKVSDTDKQFIMLPSTYLNNQIWEEYIVTEEEAKKISNGAAEPSDPFDRFVKRLVKISSNAFNNGTPLEDEMVQEHEFSDKEKAFIESAGGFRKVLIRVQDGDFKIEFRSVWESLG